MVFIKETAMRIVEAMNKNNGLITVNDLNNYQADFRQPISTNYRGNKVFTAGPPSGGRHYSFNSLKHFEFL